jgi:nucleoside-diphosphate-sugar epimerase
LGARGGVGRATVAALLERGQAVVGVGRGPAPHGATRWLSADLLRPEAAFRALAGAEVAYLTVGLAYSTPVWAEQWPVIVNHVVDAAVEHGTHLVYLDNTFAYGPVAGPMTEQTPLHPTSQKGVIRANALRALEAARAERGLGCTVARSASGYGPGAANSVFNSFVLARVVAGQDITWFCNADLPHSLTYTVDIGQALALIGTTPTAWGTTWHLPTAPALTGRELVGIAAGPNPSLKVMSQAWMSLGAAFNPAAAETLEIAYQWTQPYQFDSTAFESTFAATPTSLPTGIAATLAALSAP